MTSPPMPLPKFATQRTPERPTLGTRQGLFARTMLGQPFMPHQQLIADVAGEVVQNDNGLWVPARRLVLITEPRQAGKSHQAMTKNGERCFSVPNWRCWYTAQTGQDARDLFLKFEEENIRGRPLAPFVKLKRGRGEEVLEFPNGSRIRPHPPTEEKLHGKQSDGNDIDEAWAFTEEEGRALMQAVGPTQLTRPQAQTFIWSAGGTPSSTWLASLIARGREGDPDMAYFEWAIPDDADAEDLDVILAHHPAAGRTITRDSLAALRVTAFKGDPAGWARAAGNRWTEVIGGAISPADWRDVRYPDPIPDGAAVGYGAARSVDGSQVAIAAAADVDGRVVVELLDVLPSAYLAAEHVAGWARDGSVAVATEGPSKRIHDDLKMMRGVRLLSLAPADNGAACATIADGIAARGILFRTHPALDGAVKVAGKRNIGDGGWVWARVAAGPAIVPLEAATAAVHALAHRRPPVGRPRLVTARA